MAALTQMVYCTTPMSFARHVPTAITDPAREKKRGGRRHRIIWVSGAIFQRYVQIWRLGQPYEDAQSEIQFPKKSSGFGAQIQTIFLETGFKIQFWARNRV